MMAQPAKLYQPSHFDAFRCTGSACEDTCCSGWMIHVDKATYGKYQACSDPHFGSSLRTLVQVNQKSATDEDHAHIALNGATCPFLSEGLCSIQNRLGEEYLSNMCATYPRVENRVDDVMQRSLGLSCPEAARVVLLNRQPIVFNEIAYSEGSTRPGIIPSLDVSRLRASPDPYACFRHIQRLVISLLQDRSYPIWRRLLKVGLLCEKLDEAAREGWDGNSLDILRGHAHGIQCRAAMDRLEDQPADPENQLETVLELIVARLVSEPNPRRFLECYKEFIDGIQWTSKSRISEMGSRYAAAFTEHYAPFMERNEHMLEHYLVTYVHRTLFPFGNPEGNQRLRDERVPSFITARYMLLAAYYAIMQTLLIGGAGFHKSAFGAGHVLKAIQSCAKTFEHSMTHPARAIGLLAERAMTSPAALCGLIRTPSAEPVSQFGPLGPAEPVTVNS
jgi:lysine-N-methylase